MIYKITKCLFILLFLVSCVKDEKPEDLMSKEDMVEALIHVHLLEAKVNKLTSRRDSIQFIYDHYESILFDKHEIEKEKYDRTMAYYIENPDQLLEIYETVVDSISLRQKNQNIN